MTLPRGILTLPLLWCIKKLEVIRTESPLSACPVPSLAKTLTFAPTTTMKLNIVLCYELAISITITVMKTTLPNNANMPVCMTLPIECEAEAPIVPDRLSLTCRDILPMARLALSTLGTLIVVAVSTLLSSLRWTLQPVMT